MAFTFVCQRMNLVFSIVFLAIAFRHVSAESVTLEEATNIVQTHTITTQTGADVSSLFFRDDAHNCRVEEAVRIVGKTLRAKRCHCCKLDIYRPIDGFWNNLKYKFRGTPLQREVRVVPNRYDDGLNIPRYRSTSGELLPSARKVSLACFPASPDESSTADKTATEMTMQFGQFLDHDVVATESMEDENCCEAMNSNGTHGGMFKNGPCFPILVPPDDPFFTPPCMGFKRSLGVFRKGIREQINTATSFVDISSVYGPTDEAMKHLRSFKGGTLLVHDGNMLLTADTFKCVKEKLERCPHSGDSRVSVSPGLTVLHTIYSRNHNRLAQMLSKLNPRWSDEKLFQEARKINIAVHQKIVFYEYLPVILGPTVITMMGLDAPFVYSMSANPNIINAFAGAAYRFGHSTVSNTLKVKEQELPLREVFFRPEKSCYRGEDVFGDVIKNQAGRLQQKADNFVTRGLTDELFFGVDAPGLSTDLVARNIQRGRDHGLGTYLDYVHYCKKRFPQLPYPSAIPEPECFSEAGYNHMDDLDVFVGGLHEQQLPGATVGSTFACLIGEQFRRLRSGDRYFYQNRDLPHEFTKEQLDSINSQTLSSLLCHNSELDQIQPNVFVPDTVEGNHKVTCDQIPDIDINLWKNVKTPLWEPRFPVLRQHWNQRHEG